MAAERAGPRVRALGRQRVGHRTEPSLPSPVRRLEPFGWGTRVPVPSTLLHGPSSKPARQAEPLGKSWPGTPLAFGSVTRRGRL